MVEPPDFDYLHERYGKAIMRGRHPNSFQKNSELWWNVQASNERLKTVIRGRSIETALNTTTLSPSSKKLTKSTKLKAIGGLPRKEKTKSSYKSVNGVELNYYDDIPIQYAKQYALINQFNELLYLDKKGNVLCKPADQFQSGDRLTFSAIHLGDSGLTGGLYYILTSRLYVL